MQAGTRSWKITRKPLDVSTIFPRGFHSPYLLPGFARSSARLHQISERIVGPAADSASPPQPLAAFRCGARSHPGQPLEVVGQMGLVVKADRKRDLRQRAVPLLQEA